MWLRDLDNSHGSPFFMCDWVAAWRCVVVTTDEFTKKYVRKRGDA